MSAAYDYGHGPGVGALRMIVGRLWRNASCRCVLSFLLVMLFCTLLISVLDTIENSLLF